MRPERISSRDLASKLPAAGRVLVAGATGESQLLARAAMDGGDAMGALAFTGIFVSGINRNTYLPNPKCTIETYFLTPDLKMAPRNQVEFLPLCYADILARLRTVPLDAVMMMVAPPGADGLCSFGCAVDFVAELWERAPVRIAHINPHVPVTAGWPGIPFDALTAFIEQDETLPTIAASADDPVAEAIGRHVAAMVSDGSTLQTGLGTVPAGILRALTGKRDLRIHSGLIPEAVLDLVAAGALAPGRSITGGVAIGSPALYAAAGGDMFEFVPVSQTHDAETVAARSLFIAINSAIEVDLFGQAYSELTPKGLMSGPGGASDFARGARLGGGLSIVALASTARGGALSRIVAPAAARGPVALGRTEIDLVVTEHGTADLRGRSHEARAAALIAVAAPAHREGLIDAWSSLSASF